MLNTLDLVLLGSSIVQILPFKRSWFYDVISSDYAVAINTSIPVFRAANRSDMSQHLCSEGTQGDLDTRSIMPCFGHLTGLISPNIDSAYII